MAQKVLLTSIQALTFHRGEQTKARRSSPIDQLKCLGKACNLYQPETVACSNIGNDGLGGVQWKCEADLPSSLRFGKVEVSCEGWTKPGDRYVLQGSCGLEYQLVRIDGGMERGDWPDRGTGTNTFLTIFCALIFAGLAIFFLYSCLHSCFRRRPDLPPVDPRAGGGGLFPGFGGGGNGGGGGGGGGPPPPYFPPGKAPPAAPAAGNTNAFWTGLGVGGLAAWLATRNWGRQDPQRAPLQGGPGGWGYGGIGDRWGQNQNQHNQYQHQHQHQHQNHYQNRHQNQHGNARARTPSGGRDDLGSERRATGFGGSNVR